MTPLRFDIDGLMDRLGDKRARRAQNYFNNGWVRVVAGARLAEGFAGAPARWLREVAEGAVRLGV